MTGALLCVVDDEDGEIMSSLQLAQVGEQGGDFAAGVLVDAMQTHERIQHQQAWLELLDGAFEPTAIGRQIQPYRECGDHVNIQFLKTNVGCSTDALEPTPHDMERVFCGVQQYATRPWHGEVA
jgi:hypothetical protein